MSDDRPAILRVIEWLCPEFDPPEDTGKEWIKCLCPFHGESNPSASISYELGAFVCRACGVKGDVYSLIMHEKKVSFAEAKRITAQFSLVGSEPVRRKPERKSGRKVFGESRADGSGGSVVRTGIRSRTSPWS